MRNSVSINQRAPYSTCMHHVDVHMEAEIYGANNRLAEHNAEHFKAHGVRAFDLLGAIGSGKTSLIEQIVPELKKRNLNTADVVFIENVGNMVCPTDFKLGAEKRVVVISTTEGDDVVNKHPMMFRDCQIAVINKVDLAEAVGCNVERMIADIKRYNPEMVIIKTNLRKGEGVAEVVDAILA